MRNLHFFLLLILLVASGSLSGAVKPVSTPAELKAAVASAVPGDTILLGEGEFRHDGDLVVDRSGEPDRPIVIKAVRRGKTTLTGDFHLQLRAANHVVVEGFEFAGSSGPAVELRGCSFVRVTRNVFHLKESARSNWVMITGDSRDTTVLSHHNRVDHNLFENKKALGNFITIEGTKKAQPQSSQYDRIDHNHFRDIGPRVENALEAIRSGSAEYSLSSGFTLIDENLFERCDGDPEYISIKASDDTVRGNTFRECLGTLSLRHGNRTVVEGNFILGNNRSGSFTDSTGKTWTLGTGGVRFCGDGMRIVNNYFEGLTGTKWDATLAITNGDAEYGDGQPLTKHFRIRDAVIAFNTFVDNAGTIEIGYDGEKFQNNWWKIPPKGLTIANNIMVASVETVIRMYDQPEDARWEGNILFTRQEMPVPVTSGIRRDDPKLVRDGGVLRILKDSPARGTAEGSHPSIVIDIDGQPRGKNKDIGADQYSTQKNIRSPLNPADVGPDAP